MRRVLFILVFFIGLKSFAQYDTSLIRKAFDYIKTEEFKTALNNYTEAEISNDIKQYPAIRKRAKRYKEEERARMNFWINDTCLVSECFYFIPDTSGGKKHDKDSFSFKNFDKIEYKRSLPGCNDVILIEPYLLNTETIQLEHFFGIMGRIKMGEKNILRLKLVSGRFTVVFRGDIFYN